MAALDDLRLEDVYSEAEGLSFPRHVLERCETALVLFAAAFDGRQDAYWVAEAGLTATCVDIRSLERMRKMYPPAWEFEQTDAFEYAEHAAHEGRAWDVVSIDCPSGAFQKCAHMVDLWCALANEAVILGSGGGKAVKPPDGWQVTEIKQRSMYAGGVYWTLIEREER